MSWLTFLALTLGIGYVAIDVVLHAVVLAVGYDIFANVPLSRWKARIVGTLIALLAALMLAATVEVAVRWSALAVFPMLGALWVVADLPPMLEIGFGRGYAGRVRVVSPLSRLGGFAVLAGLVFVVIERQVVR